MVPSCHLCADEEAPEPVEPVVLAAVAVDLIGAFRAQSDFVPLDAAQASAPLFESPNIDVSATTLTGQRLMDVLGNCQLAESSGLTLTALAGNAGAALEPVGTARLLLSQILANANPSSDRLVWHLPVVAADATTDDGRHAAIEVGTVTVTIHGCATLAKLAAAVATHGSARKAEEAEARAAAKRAAAGAKRSSDAAPAADVISLSVSELMLIGDSTSWHDALATTPPWFAGLLDCGAPSADAADLRRRLNACAMLVLSLLDIWCTLALGVSWLLDGRALWGGLLLATLALATAVTVIVTLHPIEEGGYRIPRVAFPATLLCVGPPLAAARAACCSANSRALVGAHNLAADMHLTQALVQGCPAVCLQIYALLALGPARSPPLLWCALISGFLSVTHAVGSDFELDAAPAPLGMVGAEFALAFARLGAAALPVALCVNAFGVGALVPPLVGLVGAVGIAKASGASARRAGLHELTREQRREARARRWLRTRAAQELWLALVESSAAFFALTRYSQWLDAQSPLLARQLGAIVLLCVTVQLVAVSQVDRRIARAEISAAKSAATARAQRYAAAHAQVTQSPGAHSDSAADGDDDRAGYDAELGRRKAPTLPAASGSGWLELR